jgi:hypothetical protein
MAGQLAASVAMVCCIAGALLRRPLLVLIDNHLPYPKAILQVFGQVRHRRRRRGRGRLKYPDLKPPPQLLVGVVEKVRNATGKLLAVRTRALFGGKGKITRLIRRLKIGRQINTAHIERLNGTLRNQQARLTRRTRSASRLDEALQWSLWLWRDLYNWVRPHRSLHDRTPAMAIGLATEPWSVPRYVRCVVHVSPLLLAIRGEQRKTLLTSALETKMRKKTLPTS